MAVPDLHGSLWAWVQSLPPWQSDLLRRLTTIEDVDARSLEDALDMVLTDHGVSVPCPVEPVPIDALVGSPERRTTKILAVGDLVSVGSVDPGQRLEFAAEGLTIVYGENGSGKSSYARVLRRACRSSAKPVDVLPNVLKSGAVSGESPTAQLEISLEQRTRIVTRQVNAPPEPDLADVSVFDSDCASVYADEETCCLSRYSAAYVSRSVVTARHRSFALRDHLRWRERRRKQGRRGAARRARDPGVVVIAV